jgi:spermidine synthase
VNSTRPDDLERISIPAAFLGDRGTVVVREPPGTDLRGVIASLRGCDYDRPFVYDDGVVRRLHFTPLFTQSEMVIRAPNALSLAYTRKMMGFLLFSPAPAHVLMIGLGGGSLTKYCYHNLPLARITTVEIDPDVIAFGDLFALPPPGPRNSIVHGDAVDYVAQTVDRADVVLLDGCDSHGIAPAFRERSFYAGVRARLSREGVLVMNLVGDTDQRRANLRLVAEVFLGNIIVQEVSDGNQVVFAFKNAGFAPHWPQIETRAECLARRHSVDLWTIARKLRKTHDRRAGTRW